MIYFFLFKQKTAYEMRISDWSSDVCSSDLSAGIGSGREAGGALEHALEMPLRIAGQCCQLEQRGATPKVIGAGLDLINCRQHRCLVAGNIVGQTALA